MKLRGLFAFGLMCVTFMGLVQAADKVDPTGTWKWSVKLNDQQSADFSLKLKFADEKLTGTITPPNKQNIEIEDASFKDGEVTFSVKRTGPMKRIITTKYKGKLNGEAIKGTYESDRKGDNPTGEWVANREKS